LPWYVREIEYNGNTTVHKLVVLNVVEHHRPDNEVITVMKITELPC
jgi:hypothetical protein